MIQNNRYDFNRRSRRHYDNRPHRHNRPPFRRGSELAVFATHNSADRFFRRLIAARLFAEIVPFESRHFFGRQFAVRMDRRDRFLAQRLMTDLISADFLGWFDD